MKRQYPFRIGVVREEKDSLGLSGKAIDHLRADLFTGALKDALLKAMKDGVTLPRTILVHGTIEVTDGNDEEQ